MIFHCCIFVSSYHQNFTIGRDGYGKIQWLGETDIRGLDLDAIVTIDQKEVNVYDTGNYHHIIISSCHLDVYENDFPNLPQYNPT